MLSSAEILTNMRSSTQIGFHRYSRLNRSAKRIIEEWHERAWALRDCASPESFEPFIFSWISFNAWGACVTDEDRDIEIIKALKSDHSLSALFEKKLKSDRR